MQNVTKRAGVSQVTVSHVINNAATISDEVIEKVEKAIKELNHTPNILARWLKRNRANIVGLMVPAIDSEFYAEIIKGAERKLRDYG